MRNIQALSAVYVLEILENKVLYSANTDCLLADLHCPYHTVFMVSSLTVSSFVGLSFSRRRQMIMLINTLFRLWLRKDSNSSVLVTVNDLLGWKECALWVVSSTRLEGWRNELVMAAPREGKG